MKQSYRNPREGLLAIRYTTDTASQVQNQLKVGVEVRMKTQYDRNREVQINPASPKFVYSK